MMDVFVKLNYTKAVINVNAKKSNNIEYYVDTLYLTARGLIRGTFIYYLLKKGTAFLACCPSCRQTS